MGTETTSSVSSENEAEDQECCYSIDNYRLALESSFKKKHFVQGLESLEIDRYVITIEDQ